MRHSSHQKEVRYRLLKLLRNTEDDQLLNQSDFEFVMSVFKHHVNFKEKSESGVVAVTVKTYQSNWKDQLTKKFVLITNNGQRHSISHKKAMEWETPQFIQIKKLTYFAKRMQKKLIFDFREGDCICEKTWKKLQPGFEKVIYDNKISLRQLCIQYLSTLDDHSKQLLLDYEVQVVPNLVRLHWLHFLKQHHPIVVHKDF